MADPNSAERATLYLGRAQQGTVFNREFNFYPGSATVPNSFTGNQALGATSGGPGAFIINGIGPALVGEACDEPVILVTNVVFGDDNVFIFIEMSNVSPTDTFIIFNANGDAFKASNVSPSGGNWVLTFPDSALLPSGSYALKVIREGDLDCFDIEYNVFNIAGAVCAIDAGAWTFSGGVPFPPVVFPNPRATQIVGSGFTTCMISVQVNLLVSVGPSPGTLPVIGLTVINDNLLTFTVDGTTAGVPSTYEAVVICDDVPGCQDTADNFISWGFA